MGMFNRAAQFFKRTPRVENPLLNEGNMAFEGLNPLLAKQLTELETQIGQLAQVQFELSQERSRMRFEMDALKKAVEQNQTLSVSEAPRDDAPQKA